MTAPVGCRSCRSTLLATVLDLGLQPASDSFPLVSTPGPDPRWPLRLVLCTACGLVQLDRYQAPAVEMPLAVESRTSREHAQAVAREVVAATGAGPGTTLVEVDSHHGGSWYPHLLALGLVPPHEGERADVVVDVHAVAHEEELDRAMAAHAARLGPDGRLVLEFHHLLRLVEGNQFDTVRHGHPLYLSLIALAPALGTLGLRLLDAVPASAYGGSVVVVAGPRGVPTPRLTALLADEREAGLDDATRLRRLDAGARRAADDLRRWLVDARAQGRRVVGYGAPSKAAVLLGTAGVGPELLPFTVDASPAKHGRRIPGCGVPVRPVDDLLAARPDEVLLLTWDLLDEVRAALPEVERGGGRFVVPVPHPHVVEPLPLRGTG